MFFVVCGVPVRSFVLLFCQSCWFICARPTSPSVVPACSCLNVFVVVVIVIAVVAYCSVLFVHCCCLVVVVAVVVIVIAVVVFAVAVVVFVYFSDPVLDQDSAFLLSF